MIETGEIYINSTERAEFKLNIFLYGFNGGMAAWPRAMESNEDIGTNYGGPKKILILLTFQIKSFSSLVLFLFG